MFYHDKRLHWPVKVEIPKANSHVNSCKLLEVLKANSGFWRTQLEIPVLSPGRVRVGQ
jgi:hypothetical protein